MLARLSNLAASIGTTAVDFNFEPVSGIGQASRDAGCALFWDTFAGRANHFAIGVPDQRVIDRIGLTVHGGTCCCANRHDDKPMIYMDNLMK